MKRRMKPQQIRRLTTQKQKARLVQTRIPADASDSVSENTTDTAAQNENNSGEQA